MSRALLLAVAAVLGMAWSVPAHSAEMLITEQEAQLPAAPGSTAMATRGVTRGPKVILVSPSEGATQQSPVNLQVKFESFGGSKIDKDTVKVTYLKNPLVDLTKRISARLAEAGINFADAGLPPGDHRIRVDVKDTDGRTGTASFILKIAK